MTTMVDLSIPMTVEMESACHQLQLLLQDPIVNSDVTVEAFAWLSLWYQSILQHTPHPQHELLWIMELRLSPFRHSEEIWNDMATECFHTYIYNEESSHPTQLDLQRSWKTLPYLTQYMDSYWIPQLSKHYSTVVPFLPPTIQQWIESATQITSLSLSTPEYPSSSSSLSAKTETIESSQPPPSRDRFQLQLLNCKRRYDAVQHRWSALHNLSAWTSRHEAWTQQVMKQWAQWRQEWSVYSHSQRTAESNAIRDSHREQQMQLLLDKHQVPTTYSWKRFTIPQFLRALQVVERILRS